MGPSKKKTVMKSNSLSGRLSYLSKCAKAQLRNGMGFREHIQVRHTFECEEWVRHFVVNEFLFSILKLDFSSMNDEE